ncbi:MAG: ABC transporter substrate-binding protein [Alphaproteobacteria bacterium]|nr:ABC transporter substrate-binding protein [Alphaproteobacteria bacterium]
MKAAALLRKGIVAIGFIAVLAVSAAAHAETGPAATIRAFYAQLTATIKQGDALGFAGRCQKLDPVIRATFNLPLMAQMSVGASWDSASAQEKADLIDAFSEFSVATYASQFASDDGETFTVTGEKKTPNGVIVESELKPKAGDPVSLDYLMRPDAKGKYRVVDVYLDGTISQMATRRAEFSSIARRDGIDALVNSLGAKSKEMGPG